VQQLRQQHRLRLTGCRQVAAAATSSGSAPIGPADIAEPAPGVRVARPALPALERYVESLRGIWERGILSNDGPCVGEFEAEFTNYSGSRGQVLAAANCDLALTLIVAALELPRGARAVLPSYGYPSSLHALQWNGLEAHFVDVDGDDWCLHADGLEEQLAGASLIVATHMYGVPCDVAALERLAERLGVALVFDAAQAVGTWVGDRHVTDFGDASGVSFSGTKLVTSGEGAIAALHGEAIAARFRHLRRSGMDGQGTSERLGLNAKLSELHAALGTLTLGELEEQVAIREGMLALYRRRLGATSALRLQSVPHGTRPTPTYFAIEIGDRRDRVRAALASQGIESRAYFPALHLMPRCSAISRAPMPVTERLDRGVLALPLHASLDDATVDRICDIVLYELTSSKADDGK
jgi:dTDP-4-amino-4,6-dideoxygalactose transaminase